MAKRTKPCAVCAVEEGAAIFASEEWCSDDHRKVFEKETAYLRSMNITQAPGESVEDMRQRSEFFLKPFRWSDHIAVTEDMITRQEPNMIDVVRAEQAQYHPSKETVHAISITKGVRGVTECGLYITTEPDSPIATGWNRTVREVVLGVTCHDCLVALDLVQPPMDEAHPGLVKEMRDQIDRGLSWASSVTINDEPYTPGMHLGVDMPINDRQVGDITLGDGVFARQPQTWDERDAEEVARATESRPEPPEGFTWEEVLIDGLCRAVQDLQHCRQIFEDHGIDTAPVQAEIDHLAPVLLSVGHIHEEEIREHSPEDHDHGDEAHDHGDYQPTPGELQVALALEDGADPYGIDARRPANYPHTPIPEPITEAEEQPPHVCNDLCYRDLHYTGNEEPTQ